MVGGEIGPTTHRISPSPSGAFLFMMVSLLFGLPLLTGYTYVDQGFYIFALIPYLIAVVSVTLLLLYLSGRRTNDPTSIREEVGTRTTAATFISRSNSVPVYLIMSLATATVALFLAMRILTLSAYPYPPPSLASLLGGGYVILLVATSILALPRIIYRAFPVLALVLKERRYALLAIILSISFAVVYLLLVEQIVIIGYNEPLGIPTPAGKYPFLIVFTVGPRDLLVSMVYLPYVLIQINPFVTIFVVPFEVIFAVALSSLTSAAVVLGYYLVRNSGLKCCARGATLSTGASILGLTATCPTCLVPSFVSVIFGGITAAEVAYSNVYGAVLPPVLSVTMLLLSLAYLSRKVRSQTNIRADGGIDIR